MSKFRRTPEDVEAQIKKLNPKISLKHDTFVNMSTKACFVDNDHGEWWTIPSRLVKFCKHPNDIKNRKRTPESVEQQIQQQRPHISLKYDTYVNTSTKACFIDEEYGEWWTTPSAVLRGASHPEKFPTERVTPPEEVEAQIQKDRPFISLKYETYTNLSTRAIFVDEEYGEWEAMPKSVLNGYNHRHRDNWNAPKINKFLADNYPYITLDESTYIHTKAKARFIDEKYGEWWTRPRDVYRGKSNHPHRNVNISLNDVLEMVKELPYITLKKETYVDFKTDACFVDEDYGEWWVKPYLVIRRHHNHPKRSGAYTLTSEEFAQKIKKLGIFSEVDQSTYTNMTTPVRLIDEDYGEWWAKPSSILDKQQDHPKRASNYSPSIDEIKKLLSHTGLEIEGKTYKSLRNKAVFKDPKHGRFEALVSSVIEGRTVHPKRNQTFIERIVANSLGLEINTKRIYLKEDYIIPDFIIGNLLVECDGLYWHSEKYRNKWHHYKRRELCEQLGYEVLQFREDEIKQKLEIILSIINNKLGKSNQIYARKCELVELTASEAYPFFEENHLMGGTRTKAFGLLYGGELVQAMSFQSRPEGIHIGRFCSKLSTQVVGGHSKLLKAVEQKFPNKSIVNFVDLRYGSGKHLEKFGFQLEKITLGWKWTNAGKTFNRLKCRANMDERKLTQAEHAEELGWCKIYDAGQAKYIKKR